MTDFKQWVNKLYIEQGIILNERDKEIAEAAWNAGYEAKEDEWWPCEDG
jgi:hypothetical protein